MSNKNKADFLMESALWFIFCSPQTMLGNLHLDVMLLDIKNFNHFQTQTPIRTHPHILLPQRIHAQPRSRSGVKIASTVVVETFID